MVLVPLAGGRPIPLDKAIIFMGRSSDCDVVITQSRKVSRKHCCVAQIDDSFVIRDLGSMNGVRINGEPVRAESRMKVGDEVTIGDIVFQFRPLTKEMLARRSAATGGASPSKRAPRAAANPDLYSQDIPVAIPDEGVEFAVEESMSNPIPRSEIPEDEIIDLDSEQFD